jgi:glycosyltransferase involved in cell wall biosynthesis
VNARPLVSVVIPAYNAEAFIAEALASARSQQEAPAIETIVVDDGSRDRTVEIAREAEVEKVLIHQTNRGIGAARNTGVAEASGEFLAFLDADDLWPADSLAARFTALSEAGADAAFGLVEQFGETRAAEPPTLAYLPGTMLVTRSAFERVGPFDERVAVGEFIDWFARAQEAGLEVATTTSLVLRRRIHTTNTGIARRDDRVDYTRVLRSALQRRRGGV